MIDTEELHKRFIDNEGLRLKPYKCTAKKWTIGIGRNFQDNPLTPEEVAYIGHDLSQGITEEQAYYLLDKEIEKIVRALDKQLPWWRNLDNNRQFVLLDMAYQMGVDGLLGFRNTLKHIKDGYYLKAADNLMKSLYARQTPSRAEKNAYCLRTGEWYYGNKKKDC